MLLLTRESTVASACPPCNPTKLSLRAARTPRPREDPAWDSFAPFLVTGVSAAVTFRLQKTNIFTEMLFPVSSGRSPFPSIHGCCG